MKDTFYSKENQMSTYLQNTVPQPNFTNISQNYNNQIINRPPS